MIILLLISVAVMVLIPLISQKRTVARWMPIRNNVGAITALNYGNNPIERVGIGTSAAPYADPASKLAVDTLAVVTKSDSDSNPSILWTDNFVDEVFQKKTKLVFTDSIILGQKFNLSAETSENFTPSYSK